MSGVAALYAIVTVKYLIRVGRFDTDAFVLYTYCYLFFVYFTGNLDSRILRRIFNRVADQVRNNRVDLVAVCINNYLLTFGQADLVGSYTQFHFLINFL